MASIRFLRLTLFAILATIFAASCAPGRPQTQFPPPSSFATPSRPGTPSPLPTSSLARPGSPVGDTQNARVVRVIDGDTIEVSLPSGVRERIRYIGIDTPERRECYYAEATARNRELVMGNEVRLERDITDRDGFGRLLRYVYVGDTVIEAKLVEEGYARAKAYPPDTKRQTLLERLQREAQSNRRGLWGACSPRP